MSNPSIADYQVIGEIPTLLDLLNGDDTPSREAARKRLDQLGTAAIVPLAHLWRVERDVEKLRIEEEGGLSCIFVVGAVIALSQAITGDFPLLIRLAILAIAIGAGIMVYRSSSTSNWRKAVALARCAQIEKLLGEFKDPAAIPPLLDSIDQWNTERDWFEVRSPVAGPLERLVPDMDSEAGGLLRSDQREHLYSVLRVENVAEHEVFVLSVLQLAVRLKDPEALPFVRKLADSEARSEAEIRLRARAREAEVFLAEVDGRIKAGSTLLRSSNTPGESANALLRSATTAESDPEQLLRPSTISSEQPGG